MPELFDKTLSVNGRVVTLAPYTEARREALEEVHKSIAEIINAGNYATWDDIPRVVKAGIWKRKAELLWMFQESKPGLAFYEDKHFEQSKLQDTESFFLSRQIYL